MPTFVLTGEATQEIELQGRSLQITCLTGPAQVYIDRRTNGNWTSAIKGSAGYATPIRLAKNGSKEVELQHLESEHLRVGVQPEGAKVEFNY